MSSPIRILLQTTIQTAADDWHIGRFNMLHRYLDGLTDADGQRLVTVTARDRATPPGTDDPVLGTMDQSDFDQLWLFGVDTGDGITDGECAAIGRFRRRGGGLMVTRDHMDLGSSICGLGGVGRAHYFHSRQPDPDTSRRVRDDPFTTYIDFPNYHSGANGDFQEIEAVAPVHPLLHDPEAPGGVIATLPAHPHEGGIGVPDGDESARVIAIGHSKVSGRPFNLAVAFDGSGPFGPGRAVAQSTFHHFCDYNWDPAAGCPSFVGEPPGDGMLRQPEARRAVERYIYNLALWLSKREV